MQNANEMIEDVRKKIECASLSVWNCEGLANALDMIENNGGEAQIRQSLIAVLIEKLQSTHSMLSSLEAEMLHKTQSHN